MEIRIGEISMEIYSSISKKELSQRKIEEYSKMAKIVQWGRKNPVKFCELFFWD